MRLCCCDVRLCLMFRWRMISILLMNGLLYGGRIIWRRRCRFYRVVCINSRFVLCCRNRRYPARLSRSRAVFVITSKWPLIYRMLRPRKAWNILRLLDRILIAWMNNILWVVLDFFFSFKGDKLTLVLRVILTLV